MALLLMILRKMLNNKWLEISLLLGLIMSVALVSSMPIYTEAILQRMLVKDMERLQTSSQQYPGDYFTAVSFNTDDSVKDPAAAREKSIKETDDFMLKTAMPGFRLPVNDFVRSRRTNHQKLVPANTAEQDPNVDRSAMIGAISGLNGHIRLVDGKLPGKQPVDGVYEALVVPGDLTSYKMVLGDVFEITDKATKSVFKIKPVGVFEQKDPSETYWYENNLSSYRGTFYIDFDLFEQQFTSSKILPVGSSSWFFTVDYSKMNLESVTAYVQSGLRIENYFTAHYPMSYGFTQLKPAALDTLKGYVDRETKLRRMLWSLNVPVMIMLAFYLYMVANLIADRQKTEIAVLRSRGASRLQIMLGYTLEGIFLGAIAFAAGPVVGMLFTKLLGASNGFLEFVQRAALQVHVNKTAYKYAVYAVLCSIVMTLIPAFLATRTSIVTHKQQMARQNRLSAWHRFGIDLILLGVSIYELVDFERQRKDFLSIGADTSTYSINPLLLLVPALFILGFGLLVLRIYPWFVRLVYWIGRKWWPASLYATLIQVGRSSTQYQFLMVFLIITVATGIFSASAARTINKNAEEKIRYQNGADMVLDIMWNNDAPMPVGDSANPLGSSAGSSPPVVKKRIQYVEPPFEPVAQLAGIENTAKVFIKKDADYYAGKESGKTELMGVRTDDFGATAWLRDGLDSYPFYDYLNLISAEPSAVLISKSLADANHLKPGDPINIGWSGLQPANFIVYGIIEYWPTFNPNPTLPSKDDGDQKPVKPNLIVGNLDYIQHSLAIEPYQVWIKLKDGDVRQQFYDSVAAKSIPVLNMTDTREALQNAKNDPFQLAINGVMTLGFTISVCISFIGFLLYWILSLKGRILQLGIFRAMGISFRQLIGMLATEQVLTSAAAIVIGLITGNVTSRLFVGLFQLSYNLATQVPPFQVTFEMRDTLQLFAIVAVMLLLGLVILINLLSRIKIHQAVKLGED